MAKHRVRCLTKLASMGIFVVQNLTFDQKPFKLKLIFKIDIISFFLSIVLEHILVIKEHKILFSTDLKLPESILFSYSRYNHIDAICHGPKVDSLVF